MANESILLVDDEESIRTTLGFSLRRVGYSIDVAENGAEALEKIQAKPYRMVITDLLMERKTGVDVIKGAQSRNVNLPVLVITGFEGSPLLQEAMALGPCGVAFKPFDLEELLGKILKCLNLGEKNPSS